MFSWSLKALFALSAVVLSAQQIQLPRTADGKPNLQGIWQVRGKAAADLKGIVEGGEIPYQPWAAAKKLENFTNRLTADPVGKCYFPGVPRIMYMEYPFQIFQTPEHVAIAFEWSQVYRLIYTNGKAAPHEGIDSWMGDSRGRWEGNTLVVEVKGQNDKTWFDMAGDFHSDAMNVTERYTMLDADTIQYEATIQDPKVFTKSWKISMPLARQKNMGRLLEYQCQAEAEQANGAFERDPRTWYPDPGAPAVATGQTSRDAAERDPPGGEDGHESSPHRGWQTGLDGLLPVECRRRELRARTAPVELRLTPSTRGVIIDPPDRTLPYQPWARAERINRELPYRGYDDPTAHCFVAGVPRSMYVPSPVQILQPPGYVVMLFERMSWRIIPLDGRAHIPDNIRLWQGDSVGHWEGDTLVVDTTNLNGKTWLNEVGDVVSYAEHVVERFIPTADGKITYRATVTDPIAYTRPWTIEIPLNRGNDELLEVACHEDNGDLQHLKDVRDEYRAQQKKGNRHDENREIRVL